ncbi:hypothetical protein HPB51_015453 [Rhipicephalus microplus]|uniref:PDZ domain-containing protein n=1 Tax=Rhipicephalus microplus TaxID=6941 RepID=A0A9J6EAL7_RHIMP|nr:hypothetical protein HPB51_015453 [Rhipicephalus microplus]
MYQLVPLALQLTNVQIVTPKKFIYPGDVLLMINGQAVDTMDQYGVKSMLARGANEISITIRSHVAAQAEEALVHQTARDGHDGPERARAVG